MQTSAGRQADFQAISLLFDAPCIAIIGASPDQSKLSSSPLNALDRLGFRGKVVAVNPRYDSMLGRSCVRSIDELPDDVAAAMIILPAPLAVAAAGECARKGIRALVIPAQGFGEAGETERDAQLLELVRSHGLAICGPNTNGLANVRTGQALTFMPVLEYPGAVLPGEVSVVSQSGSMVSTLLVDLHDRGVGIAKAVTCGNELVLGVADYVAFLAQDPDTRVIVLYLETVRDPDALRYALRSCRASGKAVVALKMGQSEGGQRAALSHTGAIAGSHGNIVAFLQREGAVVADDLAELPVMTECLLRYRWPLAEPAKPFVMAISGGFAGLAADTAMRLGVELAEPSAAAAQALRELPTQSHANNPYDIAAQNALIPAIIDIFRRDGFNQLVFGMALLKPEIRDHVLGLIVQAKQAGLDQVFVVAPQLDPAELALLHANGISVSRDVRLLLVALRGMERHTRTAAAALHDIESLTPPDSEDDMPKVPAGDGMVDEAASKAWLRSLGVRIPAARVLRAGADLDILATLQRPLVMKGLSDRLAHKTEHGLVALGLRTDDDLRAADKRIRAALAEADPDSREVLVEEMIEGGLELIVGVQRDTTVGPVVLLGAGGLLAEFLADAVVLVPPFGPAEAALALAGTQIGRLLAGFRGRRYDSAAVIDLAVTLGRIALAQPRLQSLDINPLLVQLDGRGAVALDAKLFLAR